jgi:predicted metal-dependent phosphoesterase TrpH
MRSHNEYKILVTEPHSGPDSTPPRRSVLFLFPLVIDLHLHTTASDGRLTPAELVAKAAAAGLRIISVTDHDTVAAIDEATGLAQAMGMRVVPGVEITAVNEARDVHVLGYFLDHHDATLLSFLDAQRARRRGRAREIITRLAALGLALDADELIARAASRPAAAVGRPQIARALVAAGYVASVQEAFDRFLATGRPAFVPRTGCSPTDVVDAIHAAGGLASFAHPGVTCKDELIAPLAARGLDAIEACHSDHPPGTEAHYRTLASLFGLVVTGGSDFHGESAAVGSGRERRAMLGDVHLPAEDFAALEARAARARA